MSPRDSLADFHVLGVFALLGFYHRCRSPRVTFIVDEASAFDEWAKTRPPRFGRWVILSWCWETDAARWLVPYYEVPVNHINTSPR